MTYSIPKPDPTDRRWRTADNVLIVDGLRVWDYDRERGAVDLQKSFGAYFDPETSYWDGWFKIKIDGKDRWSLMNGERLITVDHYTGERA